MTLVPLSKSPPDPLSTWPQAHDIYYGYMQSMADTCETHPCGSCLRPPIEQKHVCSKKDCGDQRGRFREMAFLLARLRRLEERALADGWDQLDSFYETAALALSLGPAALKAQTDFDGMTKLTANLSEGRTRANSERIRQRIETETAVLSVLETLWREGARYARLDAWSNAVISRAPELAPSKAQTNGSLNRIVSVVGRERFGADWPIKPKTALKPSQ